MPATARQAELAYRMVLLGLTDLALAARTIYAWDAAHPAFSRSRAQPEGIAGASDIRSETWRALRRHVPAYQAVTPGAATH